MTTGHDLPIALRAAYLALHRRSDARFARHGVSTDQFVLLATVARGACRYRTDFLSLSKG